MKKVSPRTYLKTSDLYEVEEWARQNPCRNITRPKDPVDLVKFHICNKFIAFMLRNKITQDGLSACISKEDVEIIVNLRVKEITLDQLLHYVLLFSHNDKQLLQDVLEQIVTHLQGEPKCSNFIYKKTVPTATNPKS